MPKRPSRRALRHAGCVNDDEDDDDGEGDADDEDYEDGDDRGAVSAADGDDDKVKQGEDGETTIIKTISGLSLSWSPLC